MQTAPYPTALDDLVRHFHFLPGWQFRLNHVNRDKNPAGEVIASGLTLDIITFGYDSYHLPDRPEWVGIDRYTPTVCTTCNESWPCEAYADPNDPDGPRDPYQVHHYRIVPAATYNAQSWRRWLLEQCLAVLQHEACELFVIEDDDGNKTHPFAPNHGPGFDPYRIIEYETDEARRTSFRGTLNP